MDLTALIELGGTNPIVLFAVALALGALHGLEPGHSKTMIAAYIIASRGTITQAILLGVSAALSHSVIVWGLAAIALTWGQELIAEDLEPWFMIIAGVMVLFIAVWMFWQARRPKGHDHHHHDLNTEEDGHLDAHARAHAQDIRDRLQSGRTGTWQTILFGLTGGLIPCPAAITVFLLCLQLGKVTLGVALVSAFSIGLALTLVAAGVVAAVGLRAVAARTSRFDAFLAAAPVLSAALIAVIGVVMIWSGYSHFGHVH